MTSLHYILVADDHPAVRHLIMRAIQRLFPQAMLIEAEDGTAAIRAFQQHSLTAIVTDYNMPGATGLEVVAAVRAINAHVPILMISARADIEAAALAAGVSVFLAKPFTVQALLTALQIMLP